jgi:hypothetical protein
MHNISTAFWTMRNQPQNRLIALAVIAGLTVLGCRDSRPERVPVSGQVLIDGQPLTFGNIMFMTKGARPSSGKIREDGRFTLSCYEGENGDDGVVPGMHQVLISASRPVAGNKVEWLAPAKYGQFATSGLTFEITEPTDDLAINLTWDRSPPGKPFIE